MRCNGYCREECGDDGEMRERERERGLIYRRRKEGGKGGKGVVRYQS